MRSLGGTSESMLKRRIREGGRQVGGVEEAHAGEELGFKTVSLGLKCRNA